MRYEVRQYSNTKAEGILSDGLYRVSDNSVVLIYEEDISNGMDCPEDLILSRDLKVFVEELNRLAEIINEKDAIIEDWKEMWKKLEKVRYDFLSYK